jgi:hypothetical protein
MNRRTFILNTGLAAVATAIPGNFIAQILSESGVRVDEFSIKKIQQLLADYSLPSAEKFSLNEYSLQYNAWALYPGKAIDAGTLSIKRENTETGFRNMLSQERLANSGVKSKNRGFAYHLKSWVETNGSTFEVPLKWETETWIADKTNTVFEGTHRKVTGNTSNEIKINFAKRKIITLKPPQQLVWERGVIQLVQKMASENTNKHTFSILDENYAILPAQQVQFYKEVIIDIYGVKHTFKLYDHTGTGTVPFVYWVDKNNRVVFIISGMESYLLTNS